MPIYEYRCNACGHKLESLQRLSDAPLVACPACGKDALTKLVSAAGFQLKGSGWYATDFKNSGSKPRRRMRPSRTPRPMRRPGAGSDAKSDTSAGAKADAPAASSSTKTGDEGKSETRSPSDKPAATALARHPAARDLAQANGRGVEALPDRRASRLGSARHHHLGAAAADIDARPDAAAGARQRASRSAVRIPYPGPGRAAGLCDPAPDRCRRRQFFRRAPDSPLGIGAGPHPGRQVDLFERQAGQRHAAFRHRQCVPQGAAGRISVSGQLDDRVSRLAFLPHRSPAISPASTSASTCRPRPTRRRDSS